MAYTRAVLVVGGSGFLGTHIALRLRDTYKVFATYHKKCVRIPGVSSLPIDVSNVNWVKKIIYTIRPDVVIYVAGGNDLANAETEQKEAERLHTEGASNLSNAAELFQPKFIYISNCYVYDGQRGNYLSTETVIPMSILGKVKVGGENAVRGRSLNHIILRCSPLLGRGNGVSLSFLDKLRMLLDRGARIELPDDEIHSFATVSGLLDIIERLVDSGMRKKIFHYGGLTKVSYAQIGKLFAKRFKYNPALIIPKTGMNELTALHGTLDFSLNSTQMSEQLKIKPLLLEESFNLIEQELIPGARATSVSG